MVLDGTILTGLFWFLAPLVVCKCLRFNETMVLPKLSEFNLIGFKVKVTHEESWSMALENNPVRNGLQQFMCLGKNFGSVAIFCEPIGYAAPYPLANMYARGLDPCG
jgi:hypothetical protein